MPDQFIYTPIPASIGANPTASVGLSAVNGSAATFMRSDAAPALDQTAAYAFTGLGKTVVAANGVLSAPAFSGTGTWIAGGSATTTKPYALIEPTGTISTGWSTNGTGLGINAASGFSGNLIDAQVAGSRVFQLRSDGAMISIGYRDNVDSISVGWAQGVLQVKSAGKIGFSSTTSGSSGVFNALFTSPGAGIIQLGNDAADTTGVSQTLQAQGVTTGGTNNQAGGNLTIASGQGKGNVASSLIFQTPAVGASGNTLQTMTTALTINGSQQSVFAAGSASLPSVAVGATTNGLYSSGANLGIAIGGSKLDYAITNSSAWTSASQFFISGKILLFPGSGPGIYLTSDSIVAWGNATSSPGSTQDTTAQRSAAGIFGLRGTGSTSPGAFEFYTYAASPPAAPSASMARLYADTSGGKIRLMALFPSGAAQQIAIEP